MLIRNLYQFCICVSISNNQEYKNYLKYVGEHQHESAESAEEDEVDEVDDYDDENKCNAEARRGSCC